MHSERKKSVFTSLTLASCQVLTEFDELGFDRDAIFEWANHTDPLFRRNRMQILSTIPLLIPALVSRSKLLNNLAIERIIDQGAQLVEGVAEMIGVSRASLRYLIGKPPRLIGREWLAHPTSLLRALNLLDPASFPKAQGDWLSLRKFWMGCGLDEHDGRKNSSLFCSTDELKAHVFSGLCTSGYAINDRKLTAQWEGELGRLRDLNDYFHFVAQWCKAGAGLGTLNSRVADLAERIVSVELLKRYSAKGLIKQSEHWHFLMYRCSAEFLAKEAATSFLAWAALPGLPWHHDDHSAAALTTPELLAREGEQMNHCVASYIEQCLLGPSHIIAIYDIKTGSRSTVDFFLMPIQKTLGISCRMWPSTEGLAIRSLTKTISNSLSD